MTLDEIMRKFTEDPKQLTEEVKEQLIGKVNSYFQASYNKFRTKQRNWYIIDRFIDGDHWVVYNKVTNSIQNLPVTSGEIRRSINLADVQLRAVKNFVTRNEMRMEIHPRDIGDEEDIQKAEDGQIIAQYYYDKCKLKKLQGLLVDEGLRHGVAYFWIGLNGTDQKGTPIIVIEVKSSYDVYPDPSATEITKEKCRYIINTSKQYISDIEDNPDYDLLGDEEISAESKESASEYKSKLERDRNKVSLTPEDKDLDSAIVKDLYFRYKEDKTSSYKIGLISIAGNKLLRVKKLNISDYCLVPYYPELKADEVSPKAWATNVVSPNKAVDKMSSHIETYVLKMLNGKILAKEGSIVNKITDKQGEIVRWKGQSAPQELAIHPLPPTPFDYMRMSLKFIEDLGGMHPSSLGALPASSQSGKSIEALQAADANNVADPIKNLAYTINDLTLRLFDILSANTLTEATVKILENGEKKEATFIGGKPIAETEEARQLYKQKGTYIIDETDVKIELVPGLAYTEAGRYDKLVELASNQILPAEYLLKELRFSNVSDIIRSLERQQRLQAANQNQGKPGNPNVDPIELANMENHSLLSGQEVPPTPPELAIPEHTNLHKVFIEEMRQKGKTDQDLQLLLNHYNQEVNKI